MSEILCPSCAAKRRAETPAKLIEQVLARAPMRQWVVSFPIPLRLVLASHPEVLSRMLVVVTQALERDTLTRAGCRRSDGSKTGVVTFIQRLGSALNLNIHLPILVPDGGWTLRGGRACFHRAPAPQQAELEALLTRLIRRIMRVLVGVGVLVQDDTQPYLDLQARDALDELGSASAGGDAKGDGGKLVATLPKASWNVIRLAQRTGD